MAGRHHVISHDPAGPGLVTQLYLAQELPFRRSVLLIACDLPLYRMGREGQESLIATVANFLLAKA
jgi:hypothetical protein